MKIAGIELHWSMILEGLIAIWIGEVLDWELKRLPGKLRHCKIYAAGLALEAIIDLEGIQ